MIAASQTVLRELGKTGQRDLSAYDETFLEKSLEKRLAHLALPGAAEYLKFLEANPGEKEVFLDSLIVTYSEFFREPFTFAFLEKLALHQLIPNIQRAGRKEIRAWSAGCAAGQEAYSLAMVLDEVSTASESGITYRIFASDHCKTVLEAACAGSYEMHAIQNLRLSQFQAYLTGDHGQFIIIPRLREHVDFSFHDLVEDAAFCPPASIYGDFDLIFCSNLLMYYRTEVRQFILNRLAGCLSPEGYFFCSEAERAWVKQAGGFAEVTSFAPVFQHSSLRRNTGGIGR